MIREKLLPQLSKNFPHLEFVSGVPPEPIVVFPAKSASVGDLIIEDDGDELLISVGDITHGHFGCYESNLTRDEMEQEIVEDVVSFLRDLFADRVLLYRAKWGGGWQILDSIDEPIPLRKKKSFFEKEYFLWSGSIDVNNLKKQ